MQGCTCTHCPDYITQFCNSCGHKHENGCSCAHSEITRYLAQKIAEQELSSLEKTREQLKAIGYTIKDSGQRTERKITIDELIQIKQKLFDKSQELSKSKGHDYSGLGVDTFKNIRASEAYGMKAEKGVLVRLGDKIMRISNFIDQDEFAVKDESFEDTILDSLNYICYIYALHEERIKK